MEKKKIYSITVILMYPYYLQSVYILCMFIWAHLHTHQIDRVYDWRLESSGRGAKEQLQPSWFFSHYDYDIIICHMYKNETPHPIHW